MDIISDIGTAAVRIGLRAQGHMLTVKRMLAEHRSWDEIGMAIGWDGPTAKQWFLREIEFEN